MRVLFFSSIFPRDSNVTLGIYCLHVCRALLELGHEVRVVSPRGWLDRGGSPARAKKRLEALDDLAIEYPTYVYPPRVLQSEYHRFMALSSRAAMRRALDGFRPDCILSYWVHPDGAVAARFARSAGIPSGVIAGGSDVLILGKHPGARKRSVVRALHAIDAIITVGRDLARAVEALGIPQSKIHVIYQGVDTALFAPGSMTEARTRLGLPESGRMLVAVGSLLPVKGIDVLLDAFARIRERPGHGDLRLCLVGDGASRRDLEARAARLGIAPHVRFVGKVDQRALPDWYRAADLTVLASRSEGVPNVLRESLACGTPFVATSVGGVHEIAEGTGCKLVPPEDVSALTDAIVASLSAGDGDGDGDGKRVRASALMSWVESTKQIVDVFEPLVSVARKMPAR